MSDLKMPDITSGLANKIRAITSLFFFFMKFKVKKKKRKRKNETTFESEHLFPRLIPPVKTGREKVALTLWLDSPSRLAVVTKHVLSSRLDWRSIKSQGKVSSSFTSTTSPTCSQEPNQTNKHRSSVCFPLLPRR